MNKILIITGRYLPGYKDGGPVRTIKNLTDNLGAEYDFIVMCADRDHGDLKPYDGIKVNALNRAGKALVFYSGDGKYRLRDIISLCRTSDLVYVCGPYNNYAVKALILKKLGFIKIPFVLAPMGSFSKGALAIKSSKKQLFFKLCKLLGLYKKIYFSVTSGVEERELREALNINSKCYIAEDMPRSIQPYKNDSDNIPRGKSAGNNMVDINQDNTSEVEIKIHDVSLADTSSTGIQLVDIKSDMTRIVFLSRICEKKNLTYAIDVLSGVKQNIVFDIYGIIEDKDYYDKCLAKLEKLPDNIKWEYKGEADSENVPEVLSGYDLFLFPTMGENFGHVISEALSAGCIPVISDTTPWLDLEENDCGYVIPLDMPQVFADTITSLCNMPDSDIKRKSENAVSYFIKKHEKSVNESGYKKMFDELLNSKQQA